MSLFIQLPEDLQRVVGSFLEREELDKLSSKVFNNPNDIFWREKIKQCIPHLEMVNYQTIYDRLCYQRIFNTMKGPDIDEGLIKKLINDENFLKNHIHTCNSDGYNLLTILCFQKKDYEEEIAKLFSYGVKPSKPSKRMFDTAAEQQKYKVVEIYLKAGFEVNCHLGLGWNALMDASVRNDLKMAKILLQYGANPYLRAQTRHGSSVTALSLASSDEMKKLLTSRHIFLN